MKALVYHGNRDIRLESDWPDPEVKPGHVLLRMNATSICATDIEEWQYGPLHVAQGSPNPVSGRMAPLVMGHEAAGEVVEVGQGVAGWNPGDRVAVRNVITCGDCFWCLRGETSACPSMAVFGLSADGGLAEYAAWPATHLLPLAGDVSDEEAALNEPTTVAVHGVRRSEAGLDDTVVVLGCGTVGLLTLQVLKAVGGRVIAVDRREGSLRLAEELGADHLIDAGKANAEEAIRDLTGGIGADIVMETAGAATTPLDAIRWVRRRGRVVLVGIYSATPQVNFNDVVGFEREVIGSVAADRRDYETALGLIADGAVDVRPLISDIVQLDHAIPDGFERMIRPEKDVYRIVITPQP